MNPYYANRLQGTPLGKVIFQVASTFDNDPETRFKILSEGRASSQTALTSTEVTELKIEKLLDLQPAPIVGRMLWSYFHLVLEPAMDFVQHRGISPIGTPDNDRRRVIAGDYLDFWLAEPAYNQRVQNFYDALVATLEAYSHTRISYYVDHAISRRTELDPFEGLTIEDLKKDQHTVNTCIYQEANRWLLGECRDAYIALSEMPQINDEIGRMFFITPPQFMALYRPAIKMSDDYSAFLESFAAPNNSIDWRPFVPHMFSELIRMTV